MRLLREIRVAVERADGRRAALSIVVREICRYVGWPLGHAYVVDLDDGSLQPVGEWFERDPGRSAPLIEATADTSFRPAEGLPGRALALGEPVWVADVRAERSLPRAGAFQAAGIATGLAVPILTNGRVRAVVEFFAPEAQAPDRESVLVVGYVSGAWSHLLERDHLAEQLNLSEERFQTLVRTASDAIILIDEDGRIISWNPAATRMFGYPEEEAIGTPVTRLMPMAYRARHREGLRRALDRREGSTTGGVVEVEGLTRDGRVFPVELSLADWSTGDKRYFAGILRDVSQREAALEELRLIGSAAAHVRDAIVVSTGGGQAWGPTILYVNQAFVRMTGYQESEVIGRSFSLLAGEKTDRELLEAIFRSMREGESARAELIAYRKDGSEFLLSWNASPISEEDGSVRHYASVQRDCTEERRMKQALLRADRDALTGLPDRGALEKRLRRALKRSVEHDDYRFALLFLDLDGFKAVNDRYGHVVGDQLLTSIARRLEGAIRPGDALARFGGDEFVILLDYIGGIADVVLVVERIQERLGAPFELRGEELGVGVSVGVALSETGYANMEDIVRAGDDAMYVAKKKGSGRVEFHDKELYRDVVSLLSLREDLQRAVERRELRLEFQPLVDLRKQSIIGFEALVRWEHPERGCIPPEAFIPLAEDSGLIVPIGRWILREACTAAQGWPRSRDGAPLTLSVNLSMRELSDPGLVDAVRTTLETTGLAASRLQLELTESMFIESMAPVRARIEALRALGIAICIDDFGTGYSSLGYLHRLPIDKMKIDRLFVSHLDEAPGNIEILRTILTLARNLGMDVVAEGVETPAQLECLQDLACGYGQGFLFSRPVRPERVADLVVHGTP